MFTPCNVGHNSVNSYDKDKDINSIDYSIRQNEFQMNTCQSFFYLDISIKRI